MSNEVEVKLAKDDALLLAVALSEHTITGSKAAQVVRITRAIQMALNPKAIGNHVHEVKCIAERELEREEKE